MKWPGFIALFLSISCTSIPEPSYISIENIVMQNSGQGENSTSSAIADAWVYIDDNLEGAFELPCRIPLNKTGKHKISIGSGVWVNALPTLRSPYVFYRFYAQDAVLEAGKTLYLKPIATYNENIQIAYQAGFDSPTGNTLEATPQSDTTAAITTKAGEFFEGQGAFKVNLLREEGFVEFQLAEPLKLPKAGAFVFLELNYLSSHPLDIGLRSFYPAAGNVYSRVTRLPLTNGWQKVYINLTSAVSTEANAQNQRAVFSIRKPAGSGMLDLRLDNIRIVHFKS
jgi:hypothetical protein